MLIMAALCVIGAALPAFRAYYYRTSKDGKVHGFAHRDCFPEGNAVLIASPVTDPATVSEQDRRDIEACEIDPRVKEPTDYEYAVEEASKYVGENRALSATDPEAREAAAKNNEAAKHLTVAEVDPTTGNATMKTIEGGGEKLREAQEKDRKKNADENNKAAEKASRPKTAKPPKAAAKDDEAKPPKAPAKDEGPAK